MTDSNPLELTVRKRIAASKEQLFDAWLNPETLSRFMLPKAGMENPKVSLDPTPGGKFQIDMNVGESIIPHHGEYLEIDRANRLSFSWKSPFSVDDSVVTIDFSALSDSETEVTLHHIRFLNEEARDSHQGGWSNILESLSEV